MKILAFDSSSKALSVALLENQELLAEVNLNIKKNHSISLMPAIDFLMEQVGFEPTDLDRIAVAAGPGSYTGLRLAATVAKTLAYSLGKELVAFSSLLAIAARVQTDEIVIPILDARRGNAYAGAYLKNENLIADQHCSFEEFLKSEQVQALKDKALVFTGETANFTEIIENAALKNYRIITDSLEILPSAYELGKLAEKAEPVNIHAFAPNYLKKVEAEEKWLETHEETDGQASSYVQRV